MDSVIQAEAPPAKANPWLNALAAVLALVFSIASLNTMSFALFPIETISTNGVIQEIGSTPLIVAAIGFAIGAVVLAAILRVSWKIMLAGTLASQGLNIGALYLVDSLSGISDNLSIFVLTATNSINYFTVAWAFGTKSGKLPKLSLLPTHTPSIKIIGISLIIWIATVAWAFGTKSGKLPKLSLLPTHTLSIKIIGISLIIWIATVLKIIGISLIIWIATILVARGYVFVIELLRFENLIPTNNAEALLDTGGGFIAALIVVGVLVPLGEEFFFRNFLIQRLRSGASITAAVVFSAATFAVFHIDPSLYVPIFILGIGLAVAYIWLKSIWAPIVIHTAQNILSLTAVEFFGDSLGA